VLSVVSVLLALPAVVLAAEPSKPAAEYTVKAAFVYKFMLFTEWPQTKLPDKDQPFILSIIGEDPFGDAFKPLQNELVQGHKVDIQHVRGIHGLDESDKATRNKICQALISSHMVFICPSEQKHIAEILKMIEGHSILVVADTPGFIEAGGMIGLCVENAKVRFDVNKIAITKADLKVSSQLLRLARNVILKNGNGDSGKN